MGTPRTKGREPDVTRTTSGTLSLRSCGPRSLREVGQQHPGRQIRVHPGGQAAACGACDRQRRLKRCALVCESRHALEVTTAESSGRQRSVVFIYEEIVFGALCVPKPRAADRELFLGGRRLRCDASDVFCGYAELGFRRQNVVFNSGDERSPNVIKSQQRKSAPSGIGSPGGMPHSANNRVAHDMQWPCTTQVATRQLACARPTQR